jgi:transglutaminase superfamily protein/transglutaminase TgpA-like protein
MATLGALPAAVAVWRGRRAALATGAACAVVAVGAAAGVWPWRSRFGYPGDVYTTVEHGARLWFETHTPFDPGRFTTVDADVRLALFGLVAVLAWLILVRGWAVAAIGVAFFGFALPSTVVNIGASGFRAALFLALALLVLRALVRLPAGSGSGQAFGVGTAVVAAALIVSALPGVNKGAFLNWHDWNPLAQTGPQVGVNYVWDQTYAPLHWPKKTTTVLEVWAPRPMYWRVATLEVFKRDRWVLQEQPLSAPGRPGTPLAVPGGFLPSNAISGPPPSQLAKLTVKVDGLADHHLVGAGQALSWSPPSNVLTSLVADGGAVADRDLPRGTTYTSEIFAPNPTINQLQQAGGTIPAEVSDTATTVAGKRIPMWPSKRHVTVPIDPALIRASNQVWHRSGADTAKTIWAAAADVEAYLRHTPFVYDQTPRYKPGVPVLADFMLRSHHGYCQMFSGSMALVLRLHGIPTRVGVGFTTGVQQAKDGPYVVTDHDAHAWVEVYFAGWGWQQFDPTPTRHLPTDASTSNQSVYNQLNKAYDKNPSAAAKLGYSAIFKNQAGPNGKAGGVPAGKLGQGHGAPSSSLATPATGHRWRPGFISAAVALALALLLLLALAKAAAIRARYLRSGPRARAAAAYHELSTFLGDQGVPTTSSRTFEDLSGELDRVYGVDGAAFARSASRARYGPERGAGRAEREMRRELRHVKRDLRRQLTRRERAAGALRLRAALSQTTSLD